MRNKQVFHGKTHRVQFQVIDFISDYHLNQRLIVERLAKGEEIFVIFVESLKNTYDKFTPFWRGDVVYWGQWVDDAITAAGKYIDYEIFLYPEWLEKYSKYQIMHSVHEIMRDIGNDPKLREFYLSTRSRFDATSRAHCWWEDNHSWINRAGENVEQNEMVHLHS